MSTPTPVPDAPLRHPDLDTPTTPRGLWLRRVLATFAGLLILLAIALVITGAILRHDLRANLLANENLLDGRIAIAGLTAPVTITRNAQNVPSIHAANLDDLLFAQGYITASDRLFQMDALRRHGAGTLAEILGPSLIQHDREQRILQLRAAADRAAAALPPGQLHQLQAYANGVNAFINGAQKHSSAQKRSPSAPELPIEFHILHYTPALWQPRDSLLITLVMAQDLATSFPTKLNREALAASLPANLVPDLYPTGSWRDHPPIQDAPNLTTPSAPIIQIPLDRTQSSLTTPPKLRHLDRRPQAAAERPLYSAAANAPKPLTPAPESPNPSLSSSAQDLLRLSADLSAHRCDGCRPGSNNWAVAGSHTATGAPLLSNDMHLGLTAPDIWYEAALHIDTPNGLSVEGFTLPGVPFVIVGRNPYVAWGFTNSGADVQDVLIEHLRTTNNITEYERRDPTGVPNGRSLPAGVVTWSPVTHHPELIRVRGGHDIHLDVLTTDTTLGNTTIQTPIITPLIPSEHRALALAWTIYDPSTLSASFLTIDSATDAASLVAAFASFTTVSQNLIYADAHHIGYHLLGSIPIRGPATQVPQGFSLGSHSSPEMGGLQPPGTLAPLNTPNNQADTDDESGNLQAASGNPQAPSLAPPLTPSSRPEAAGRSGETPVLPLGSSAALSPSAQNSAQDIGSPISPIPVDALDATQTWSGYIPYNQLPAVEDPTSGILATANARITPPNYPYAITLDWADPYRVERIHHLLAAAIAANHPLTSADMLRIQTDIHSEFDLLVAQRLAYALDHSALTRKNPQLQQAANILRNWNGDVTVNSAAADITSAAQRELWPMLLVPQFAAHARSLHKNPSPPAQDLDLYTWGERRTALEQLLQDTPARWLPPTFANWNDLLTTAVQRSLRAINAPHNLNTLTYGPTHPIEIAHPIFGSHSPISTLLGVALGTGPHPNSGDPTTIKAAALHFGPSERFTADLSNPDNTQANITTGESGNPASPHFLDQFQPWLQGLTYTLPLNHLTTTHTLTLTPK